MYTHLEEVMAEALLKEVDTYISHRHNTVAQFIAARNIMELFLAAERRPGSWVANQGWWWDKYGLELEKIRTEDREAEQREEG